MTNPHGIHVYETIGRSNKEYNIYSRLLTDRTVFLTGTVRDSICNSLIAQLIFLDNKNSELPIEIILNTSGGSCTAGLALYDCIQYIKSPVIITCMGIAASMGAVLLASGTRRIAGANAEIMIHQPSWQDCGGKSDEVQINAKLLKELRLKLDNILAKHTGRTLKYIQSLTDKDTYLSPEQAIKLGLIDEILEINK